jgi:hypothetical protein
MPLTFQYAGMLRVPGVEIEVLAVPRCPNRAVLIERLRVALDAAGLADVAISERVVASDQEAATVGMHGSPTLHIDGRDPFPTEAERGSLSCRLYATPAGVEGAPTVADLMARLTYASKAAGR